MGSGHSTTARSRSAGPGLDLLDLGRDSPKWGDIQGKPVHPRHIASTYDSIFNRGTASLRFVCLRLMDMGRHHLSAGDCRAGQKAINCGVFTLCLCSPFRFLVQASNSGADRLA